ncbi:MAG: histidine phosphatase family protein [Deltaproteobacteria bacterium]|nr:histidine phosphatase family protein [Deltaproteobacteria bacterium]
MILVRHGESEGNRAQRFSPNPDISLTEIGIEQAVLCGHRAEGAKRGMSDKADVMTKSRLCASWPPVNQGTRVGSLIPGCWVGSAVRRPGRSH